MFIYMFNQMSLSMRMKGWMCAYIVIAGLLLLVAPACALVPDKVEVGTSSEWLTAGSSETAIITVQVSDSTTGDTQFGGAAVEFAVDSAFGSITPAVSTTGSTGMATAVFTPKTTSGTAPITARVSYEGLDEPLTGSVDQQIDHAAPSAIANICYEPEVTAGGTTEIVVRMVDRYGNPVDSRREAETVHYMVGSPAGFVDGESFTDDILVPVDASGNAVATLRADTQAGENLVWIQPPVPLKSDYISIFGVAGLPFSIIPVIAPASGSVPADGGAKVSFTYTLYDENGNPSGGQGLWVNASVKRVGQPDKWESRLLNSNSRGEVMITYGPEDSVGAAIITATAAASPSVTNTTQIEFTSTDPVNMLLTANPQSMPSRDVREDFVSQLRAKVMDENGNPVGGQTVTFEIVSSSFAPYNQTVAPALEKPSAITNADGYAIVGFYPGAFTFDEGASGWSETATGTATVQATWNGTNRDIELTWKNYPYLSVETAVSPETVAVNGTVNVTIRLRGDGWALQPDPIDVVLCTDRSGSMLKDYPDRMVRAMEASELFNTQMNYPRDHLGLVSFGKNGQTDLMGYGYHEWLGKDYTDDDDATYRCTNYPSDRKDYANYATVDLPMSSNPSTINTTIKEMVPDWGTPMRSGIYKAINELKVNGRADAVKAVIVLSDGDYNHYGDPLARGESKGSWAPSEFGDLTANYLPFDGLGVGRMSNQNMSVFAVSNDIHIYSIAFARDITDGGKRTLRILAESTGGKYYYADSGDDLAGIYSDIAGELKTEAGVDTELDVVFENVEVNEAFELGADVFDYVHMDGISTTIESWVDNETGHYVITPKNTADQTADWNDDHTLHFDIGTVRLGQTWETTFCLKVMMEGNINIFGPGSTITFNNGTDSLTLPDTFITAYPLNNTGMDFWGLNISNLRFTGEEPVDEFLPVAWDLNYTGLYGVTEEVFYSNDNKYTWVKFDTLSATNETTGGASTLDVRGLPAGDYIIRVRGYAPDTEDASDELTQEVVVGANGSAYIRLQ